MFLSCTVCSLHVWSYSVEEHFKEKHPGMSMPEQLKDAVALGYQEWAHVEQLLTKLKAKNVCKGANCACTQAVSSAARSSAARRPCAVFDVIFDGFALMSADFTPPLQVGGRRLRRAGWLVSRVRSYLLLNCPLDGQRLPAHKRR